MARDDTYSEVNKFVLFIYQEFVAEASAPPCSSSLEQLATKHKRIIVFGDGRCFFRCLATYLSPTLQEVERRASGLIKSKELAFDEQTKADKLRHEVCNVLHKHRSLLIEMSSSMGFLLDNTMDNDYKSVNDRIKAMSMSSTYVGNLEIIAAAFLLRRQIIIHCESSQSSAEFEVVARLPTSIQLSNSPINLYHNLDTRKQGGHFDLLLMQSDELKTVCLDDSSITDALSFCLMQCSDTHKSITFEHFLSDHIGKTTPVLIDGECDTNENDSTLASKTSEVSQLELNDNKSASSDTVRESEYPTIWNLTQATDFTKTYPWLLFKNGCLGCKTCQQVTGLGVFKKNGIKLSKEWVSGTVTFNGNGRQNQLSSLRKKMHIHEEGSAHVAAQTQLLESSKKTLGNAISSQQRHLYDSTDRIMRTVYSCMKNNRPFTDVPKIIELQEVNGLDMGIILHSEDTAGLMADLIASEMRKKLCTEIIKSEKKFALVIDESTTFSSKSVLILYLRAFVCTKVTTFFLDLIELEKGDAATIVTAIKSCLLKHGFTHEHLQQHLIAVCSDGASVMIGVKSGVLTELGRTYPLIIKWHCLCHRIELSVSDTLEAVSGINHFKTFMDKLYSIYSQSPKNQRELQDCAKDLDVQLRKIGKMLSVRWVASSFRSVSAVYNNYAALYHHFISAADDIKRDSKTRETFRGLAKILTSEQFVLNLGLMLDSLSELKVVSEALQRDDITLQRAFQLISRSIRVFEKMKDTNPQHVQEAIDGVENLQYKNVTISKVSPSLAGRQQPAIDRKQFWQSLIDNLNSRLYATVASNRSSKQSTRTEHPVSDFEELIEQVCCCDYGCKAECE